MHDFKATQNKVKDLLLSLKEKEYVIKYSFLTFNFSVVIYFSLIFGYT